MRATYRCLFLAEPTLTRQSYSRFLLRLTSEMKNRVKIPGRLTRNDDDGITKCFIRNRTTDFLHIEARLTQILKVTRNRHFRVTQREKYESINHFFHLVY